MQSLLELPIDAKIDEITQALCISNVVLIAEPGAGKTTRVPRALLEKGIDKNKKTRGIGLRLDLDENDDQDISIDNDNDNEDEEKEENNNNKNKDGNPKKIRPTEDEGYILFIKTIININWLVLFKNFMYWFFNSDEVFSVIFVLLLIIMLILTGSKSMSFLFE